MRTRLFRRETGQALVQVTLTLFVLMGFLALAVDVGRLYVERWRMQNAADAGALAGTRALFLIQHDLVSGTAAQDPVQVAQEYARRNGAQHVTVSLDLTQTSVRVVADKNFPTFVAGIVGINTMAAENPAKALPQPVKVVQMGAGVYPITLPNPSFKLGEVYDIYGGEGPGNFGWLSWDGAMSEGVLANSLVPPGNSQNYTNPTDASDHMLTVGDWVWGRPGIANSSDVRAQLDAWIQRGLGDEPIPITVVVWDQYKGTGSTLQYRIAGFASFILEDYRLPGQENRIRGKCVDFISSSDAVIQATTTTNYGGYHVKLTE